MSRTALCAAIGVVLSLFACHKTVWAAPIVSADPSTNVVVIALPSGDNHSIVAPARFFAEPGNQPSIGDYLVIYQPDGYMSWSPKAIFEGGYSPQRDGMTFGEALEAMKAGKRVARAGWNGKGMWLAYTPGSEFASEHAKPGHAAAHRAAEAPNENVRLLPHIDMRAADGSVVIGWTPNTLDVLADDWHIITNV